MANNNTKDPSPQDYDKLVERVLSLEMYIEKNGLDVPEPCTYPKLIHVVEVLYTDITEMLLHTRSYPMGIKAYNVLSHFKTSIESLNITSKRIRWYQKPSMWPNFIRECISKSFAKKYQKQSDEDSYGN